MPAGTLLENDSLAAVDYRCQAGPGDRPFPERHARFSLSYVISGSFGLRTRGRSYELVAGSILLGYPGDEYLCTHDHPCGDECLSFQLTPAVADAIGKETGVKVVELTTHSLPEDGSYFTFLRNVAQVIVDGLK